MPACRLRCNAADALRNELQAVLVAREQQVAPHSRARTGEAGTDVTLRVEVLCMEPRWGEALALEQPPARCQPSTLRALARNLGKEHQIQRIELKLVEEICGLLDATRRRNFVGGPPAG